MLRKPESFQPQTILKEYGKKTERYFHPKISQNWKKIKFSPTEHIASVMQSKKREFSLQCALCVVSLV